MEEQQNLTEEKMVEERGKMIIKPQIQHMM